MRDDDGQAVTSFEFPVIPHRCPVCDCLTLVEKFFGTPGWKFYLEYWALVTCFANCGWSASYGAVRCESETH
jgi:hypothetical protein